MDLKIRYYLKQVKFWKLHNLPNSSDFQIAFKKLLMSNKSTSIANLHDGHYKTIIRSPKYNKKLKYEFYNLFSL